MQPRSRRDRVPHSHCDLLGTSSPRCCHSSGHLGLIMCGSLLLALALRLRPVTGAT